MAERKRIDMALVDRGLFASRAKAREAIEAGLVRANGKIMRKPSEDVAGDAHIEAQKPYPWVSRGGVKLAAALDAFDIDPSGQVCLDVGASTGGFTHVLLTRGAARVYAVDVGHGQLHPSIASDARVTAMEKFDARHLHPGLFSSPPQLIVCDVSFISLKLVLPHVLGLAAADTQLVALIKPQFEAGRANLKKGVVRDEAVREAVCRDIEQTVAGLGWESRGIIPSPIAGGDGNREFLIAARRAG